MNYVSIHIGSKVFTIQCELPLDMRSHQVFTWIPHGGEALHVNSTGLFEYWRKHPHIAQRINCIFTAKDYEQIKTCNGIEPHRLQRLSMIPVELLDPIMVIKNDDNTDTVIDGSHRIVSAWQRGRREVRAIQFPYTEWQRARVFYPPELEVKAADLTGYSGIA